MAFFDDFGKKISEKGQSAVKKTKDFAEVTKINSMISDEEKNINNNYLRIGKLFTSMHADDCEDEFKGMIGAIRQSETKIAEYKEQIHTIKGVVKCEKCGAEVSIQSAFCSSCGASMPKRAPEKKFDENMVVCSNCGNSVKKGIRFCTHCGNAMQEIQTETHEPIAKICPKCGEESVEEDSAFCNSCGTRLIEKGNSPMIKEKRCPNCGFSTSDNEIDFCTECGTKLL